MLLQEVSTILKFESWNFCGFALHVNTKLYNNRDVHFFTYWTVSVS